MGPPEEEGNTGKVRKGKWTGGALSFLPRDRSGSVWDAYPDRINPSLTLGHAASTGGVSTNLSKFQPTTRGKVTALC